MEARSIVEQPDRRAASDGTRRAARPPARHVGRGRRRRGASTRTYVDARGAAVTERDARPRRGPQPGERVLELACGPGGVGLAAAGLVAPGGEVVLSDVVAEMTAIAAARAAAARARQRAARACSTSRASTSPTPPTTSCSAARG